MAQGCILFVKLCQFQAGDVKPVSIATGRAQWLPGQGGLQVMPLHSFGTEHTALVKWPKGERFKPHYHVGGEEILVVSGVFQDEFGAYGPGTWMRSPHMSQHFPFVEEETIIWVKTGHLALG
jgi:anti-sigma factor ChrR (cupin superfamily)